MVGFPLARKDGTGNGGQGDIVVWTFDVRQRKHQTTATSLRLGEGYGVKGESGSMEKDVEKVEIGERDMIERRRQRHGHRTAFANAIPTIMSRIAFPVPFGPERTWARTHFPFSGRPDRPR